MTAIEPAPVSNRLLAAAEAERKRLQRKGEQLKQRRAFLARELASVGEAIDDVERRLALVNELAGPAKPNGASEDRPADETAGGGEPPRHGYLRGAEIRKAAVSVLAASTEVEQPLHYTRWYQLVVEAGFGVAGRDPVAAFLTQVARSPVVTKREEPGTYALDLGAVDQIQARRRALQQELLALHQGQQTIDEIATVRERREDVTNQLAQVERALEEAIESLALVRIVGDRDVLVLKAGQPASPG